MANTSFQKCFLVEHDSTPFPFIAENRDVSQPNGTKKS